MRYPAPGTVAMIQGSPSRLRSPETVMRTALVNGSAFSSHARSSSSSALTRKQFAVLEVLVGAEGGVVSAEELLERAWDENADPFTNAVRITVSGLRKRLGEPWIIATVPGAGYRIDTQEEADRE